MKRNLLIGSTLAALLVALGLGQGILEKKADAQAKSNKIMVPRFEVDPTFPKPLPNHWYQGSRSASASTPTITSGSSIVPTRVNAIEAAEDRRPARAARRRRRFSSSTRHGNLLRHWGGQDGDGYKWPGVEPRHHHRPQGQRLDRRQRRGRRHGAEVHPGRQVPDADRQEGRADRQQQHRALRHGRQDLRRREGATRSTSPTATATSASS